MWHPLRLLHACTNSCLSSSNNKSSSGPACLQLMASTQMELPLPRLRLLQSLPHQRHRGRPPYLHAMPLLRLQSSHDPRNLWHTALQALKAGQARRVAPLPR